MHRNVVNPQASMRFCYSFLFAGLFAATTISTVSGEKGLVTPATIASTVVFKTIKAVNSASAKKDFWKIVGEQAVDERVPLQAVVDCDVKLELYDGLVLLDEVDVDCELRGSKDNAIACGADGARYNIKRVSTR